MLGLHSCPHLIYLAKDSQGTANGIKQQKSDAACVVALRPAYSTYLKSCHPEIQVITSIPGENCPIVIGGSERAKDTRIRKSLWKWGANHKCYQNHQLYSWLLATHAVCAWGHDGFQYLLMGCLNRPLAPWRRRRRPCFGAPEITMNVWLL